MTFDLNPTEDQRQILDAAETLLNAAYPLSRLRDGRREDHTALAEFGAFAFPEVGFTVVEEALLHVQLGRQVVGPGSLAAPLAVRIAALTNDTGLSGSVASGETPVAAALPSGDGLLLLDPPAAGHAVVFTPEGPAMIALDGLEMSPADGLGHSIRLARAGPVPIAPVPDLATTAALLVSAQLLGIATAAQDLAVAYAGDRRQFGRPIGAFQAVKHRAADMALRTEMLSAQLDIASLSLAGDTTDARFQVAALARLAARTALENARACVQIHGGIGFSAEADAHHFVKQAHLLAQLLPKLDLLGETAPLGSGGPP